MADVPLLIEFAPHTSLYRERELVSQLLIIRNGPAATFVVFSTPPESVSAHRSDHFRRRYRRLRSSGVWRDAVRRIGRGTPGVCTDSRTVPEDQLSPDRSHKMLLDPQWVATIAVDGRRVWAGALEPSASASGCGAAQQVASARCDRLRRPLKPSELLARLRAGGRGSSWGAPRSTVRCYRGPIPYAGV
jgi:hypothetical protein